MTDSILSDSMDLMRSLKAHGIEAFDPMGGIVYKYVTLQAASAIIENSTLRFGTADRFNDPFELSPDFFDTAATKEQIGGFVNATSRSPRYKRRELIKELSKNPAKLASAYCSAMDAMKRKIGICCFSKIHDSPLMWTHYSGEHTGVCLGFYLAPLSVPSRIILNVKYTTEIEAMKYFEDKNAAVFCWLATKSSHWAYENEVRAFYPDRSGYVPFDKRILTEVYFGVRTSSEEIAKLRLMLAKHGYTPSKISRMQMASRKFQFETVPLT